MAGPGRIYGSPRRTLAKLGLLLLGWFLAASVAAEDAKIAIELLPQGDQLKQREVDLVVADTSSGQVRMERRVALGSRTEFVLPANRLWEAKIDTEGYWSEQAVFLSSPDLRSVALDVFASATLKGRLTAVAGDLNPDELRIRFRSSSTEDGVSESNGSCELAEHQSFLCVVPAAKLDVKLRVSGFASKFFWSLDMSGGEQDLGIVELERGASLVGTVETADGSPLSREARLRLTPAASGVLAGDSRAQADLLDEKSELPANGFFQLTDILPGTYEIVVSQPGFAPTRMGPISILPGSESELREPLVLLRPVSLSVAVDPPLDIQGRPWNLEVLAESPTFPGSLDTVLPKTPVDSTGQLHGARLTPGYFFVKLIDQDDSVFLNEFVYVESSTTLTLEPDLVRVEGEVLLAGEPLGATLWFGGRNGPQRIELASNEVGWFEGVLPRDGDWRVDVHADIPRIRRDLYVEVEKGPNGSPSRLDLSLSDYSISGEIVTETGELVDSRALVTAWKEGDGEPEMLQYVTDGDGTFEFRGLEEARYRLIAQGKLDGRSASSESITVASTEGAWGPAIELVLRQTETLSGTVSSPNGSVPLARVQARPLQNGRVRTQFWPEVVTDVQGRFRVEVPAGTDQVEFLVFAPGRELKAFSRHAPFDDLQLNVNMMGGTIQLSWTDSEEGLSPKDFQPVLFQDGKIVGPAAFRRWALESGVRNLDPTRMEIPLMAPGEYSACLATPTELMAMGWIPTWPDPSRCVGGYLQPHGTLFLELFDSEDGLE